MKRTSLLLFSLCVSACGQMPNPLAPAVESSDAPVTSTRSIDAGNIVWGGLTAPSSFESLLFTWDTSTQYRQTLTVKNAGATVRYGVIVVFETFYPETSPLFFSTQKRFSVVDVAFPIGATVTTTAKIPEGCRPNDPTKSRTNQTDLFVGITAAQVTSGAVNVQPPARNANTWRMGKSKLCAETAPVPPPP
ncbi:MAG TPA: hypothetical protein VK504_03955, partial [Vicinamibacterales bacterium]|nr:hypothetical protein [Vicinamibacterales bacterium]